jgi:hypothetical protein
MDPPASGVRPWAATIVTQRDRTALVPGGVVELQGKVAVVTGAASGIGRALSERFLTEGMSVVMADIEEPVLEQQAAHLAAGHPGRVLGVHCDVSDAAQVRGLKETANESFGLVQVSATTPAWPPGEPRGRHGRRCGTGRSGSTCWASATA